MALEMTERRAGAGVLLVDDQPNNLLAMEAALEGQGHDIVKARSGEEALKALLKGEFAVILLDVQMPDMSGFELAGMIRRRERLRDVPLIFVTAINKSEENIARGYELGAVDYIFKPIVPEILRAKVAVFVELAAKNREIERQREALVKTVAELERSNADLEQFAYVAAHDLKEPMRTVAGYMQLLSAECRGKIDAGAQDLIGRAVDGALRMQTLIDGLLAYARVQTQGRPLEPTDSNAACGAAVDALREAVEESRARVTRYALPKVLADPVQLGQLFQNLVGNALKFRGDRPPEVAVGATREGAQWVFFVRDNGIGIADRHGDRLFRLFQRLHSRQDYPGTGIGLATSKRIVERHGGRIWFESREGEGSTFYFTLPAAGQQADRA